MTTVVVDTGELSFIRRFQPDDAAVNPTLLLKADRQSNYQPWLQVIIRWATDSGSSRDYFLQKCTGKFTICISKEISQSGPSRITTEADTLLPCDRRAMIKRFGGMVVDFQGVENVSEKGIIATNGLFTKKSLANLQEDQGRVRPTFFSSDTHGYCFFCQQSSLL